MKKQKNKTSILFPKAVLLALFPLIFACNSTRLVPENKFLLTANKLVIGKDVKIETDELFSIIKQKPNRKVLGVFRTTLWVYNYSHSGKEGWVKKQINKTTLGEEPVILNEELTQKSTDQINLFLKNKGYFNSRVTDSTHYFDKKAKVIYTCYPGIPYTIRKIIISINDTSLIKPLKLANVKPLLKPGDNFDVDLFDAERDRLSGEMKNLGYYDFVKDYISFEMDTALGTNQVDVKMIVKNPVIKNFDSIIESKHSVYFIRNVYINSLYDPKESQLSLKDTISYNNHYFLKANVIKFKPKEISRNVFIKKGDLYREQNIALTHNRLSALKTFRTIGIRFTEVPNTNPKLLDCNINLVPLPRQAFSIEWEGTHRYGNLGSSVSLVYQNKNAFKGAEILEMKFKTGGELQRLLSDSIQNEQIFEGSPLFEKFIPFNTAELGGEANVYIPRFWLPFNAGDLPKFLSPKTNMSFNYHFQKRPDFIRQVTNIYYGYSWKSSAYHSHSLIPADVSTVRIEKTKSFEELLNKFNNPFLNNSFRNYMILSSRYSYSFSNQELNKQKNFRFIKVNSEWAGNTMRLINNLMESPKDESGTYEIAKIRYAQYVKSDVDLRFYNVINKRSNIVYRLFAGLGLALENSPALPFDKSFFSGGSNGIRAWTARSLGPGSYYDPFKKTFDKIGDIQLEGNAEYRFDIIKMLKGALFVDAGNIWLIKNDPQRPGSKFDINDFYSEIAMGGGFGARLDFSFFIIRLDMGFQLKDPSLPKGERWVFEPKTETNKRIDAINNDNINANLQHYGLKKTLNLGIGYPF